MTIQQQSAVEMFLMHLRYKEAQYREAGGNQPIFLTDPANTWVVYKGHVDLFLVPLDGNRIRGARTHLFRAEAGDALFGAEALVSANGRYGLLAVGNRQAAVLRVPTHRLHALSIDSEYQPAVIRLVDTWIQKLSATLIRIQPPKDALKLSSGELAQLRPTQRASARKGVIWVRHAQGHSQFLGDAQLPSVNGRLYWPLSPKTWLESTEQSELETTSTQSLMHNAKAWPGLTHFHQVVLTSLAQWQAQEAANARHQLTRTVESAQSSIDNALVQLAAPLSVNVDKTFANLNAETPLLSACELIGDYLGVPVQAPPPVQSNQHIDPVQAIARASTLHTREVLLKGEWWRRDNGPLLSALIESGQPVALLPTAPNRYVLHNPTTKQSEPVTAVIAEQLGNTAVMFYRPLPERPLGIWDIMRFVAPATWPDLRRLGWAALAIGLLSLVVPAFTGLLFDTVVPNGALNQLYQFGAALIMATFVTALFQVVQNIAVLRLQDKWGATLQAAIWQRLLNLPVSFFRDYTAGNLGMRVMGINVIQQTLSGTLVGSLLAGFTSLFSFGLMFYLNARLAWVALGLALLVGGALIVTGLWQVRYQRELQAVQGNLSGLVLQTVSGISKFRIAGTEHQAFSAWSQAFGQSKQIMFKSRDAANRLVVFNVGYVPLATAVIFALVYLTDQQAFSTAEFLSFNAAFMQLVTSLVMLSGVAVAVAGVVPAYERLKPILETSPELDTLKQHPGELNGRIELSQITFRYQPDKPSVLQNLSLAIEPGQFVAIVGSSGAGKSTLLRLLLGFDEPESGTVYYDAQDMSRLDIQAIRQQIGVVLQSSRIMPGSIMENIIGSSMLTVDDAWEAAKMAGLDEDIRQMPMGMHTMIGAGGGTLSGGQSQRLLIARAVANRPRILFFDEATSALDNTTQAVVSESLENLQSTRIIIAHRLSTIMNADKIYVLDKGQVVESGTYQQLMELDGLFAELAQRQMA